MTWTNKSTKDYCVYTLLSVLVVASITVSLLIFKTGSIAADAMDMYLQMQGDIPVHNWHSPILVRLWQLYKLITGSENFIVPYLSTALPVGFALILAKRPTFISAILLVLILVTPFGIPQIGMLLKDQFLGVTLVFYCCLAIWFPANKLASKAGILLLLFISLIRVNAAFITAPLIVLSCAQKLSKKSLYAVSLVTVLLLLFTVNWTNQNLLKAENASPGRSLQIFDLSGIAYYAGTKPTEIKITYSPINGREGAINTDMKYGSLIHSLWNSYTLDQKLSVCYNPLMWDNFYLPSSWGIYGPGVPGKYFDFWPEPTREFCGPLAASLGHSPSLLTSMWLRQIYHHPFAYIHHRFTFFSEGFLGNTFAGPHIAYWNASPGYYYFDRPSIVLKGKKGWRYTSKIIDLFSRPYCYGTFWLSIGIFLYLVTFSAKNGFRVVANVWAFASVMYLLGYFFVGVGSEYRYLIPSAYLDLAIICGFYVTNEFPKCGWKKIVFYALVPVAVVFSLPMI